MAKSNRSHSAKFFAPDSKAGAQMRGSIAGILDKFVDDIKTKALRSAAYAGAKVFYDEMKARAPVDEGTLRDAIYHYHVDAKSGNGREVYHIGPNKSKAPHWFNVEYGHWRYNASGDGFWQKSKSNKNARVSTPGVMDKSVHDLPGALDAPVWVMPSPYARPTFDAKSGEAVKAMQRRLIERIRELRNGSGD